MMTTEQVATVRRFNQACGYTLRLDWDYTPEQVRQMMSVARLHRQPACAAELARVFAPILQVDAADSEPGGGCRPVQPGVAPARLQTVPTGDFLYPAGRRLS